MRTGWGQGRDAGAGTHPWALAPIWGGGGGCEGACHPFEAVCQLCFGFVTRSWGSDTCPQVVVTHSLRSVAHFWVLSPVLGWLSPILWGLSPISGALAPVLDVSHPFLGVSPSLVVRHSSLGSVTLFWASVILF